MQLSKQELRTAWEQDRARSHRRFAAVLLVTIAAFLLCLCVRYNAWYYPDKFVPGKNLESYILALRLLASQITGGPLYYQKDAVIEAFGSIAYYGALARLRITLVSFVAGAALAIAGAIFQTAYRNPMASPNIIGATAGVSLGNVVVVTLFSAKAYENIVLRYEYCYGFTILCVGLVLLLGKLSGARRKNYGLLEMVMAGSIVSQVVRVFAMYFMYQLTEEDLVLYEEISLGTYVDTGFLSMAVFFTVMAVSILPVLLTRYRLNALGMDRAEADSIGVPTGRLRIVAQICGVLMVTCSMIHCGEIGMLSLVIPYIVRRTGGADFRHVCVFSALAGGTLLMLCNLASSFLYIADAPIPVTFLIELVLVPAFMLILARNRSDPNEI